MLLLLYFSFFFFFFQAEDGIRDAQESRGLGDVYKRQAAYSAGPVINRAGYRRRGSPQAGCTLGGKHWPIDVEPKMSGQHARTSMSEEGREQAQRAVDMVTPGEMAARVKRFREGPPRSRDQRQSESSSSTRAMATRTTRPRLGRM
eukprot:TRINITY_DN19088_c0_g1_i1.p1 TRINITY_DN19088_c0_g1~~TRINITY_DN19088_c0_g1_i1.p1  ORF type:complete len:146 (-),score=26.70 TRINITY_DN19088_c0_g1_i1:241-678(-)